MKNAVLYRKSDIIFMFLLAAAFTFLSSFGTNTVAAGILPDYLINPDIESVTYDVVNFLDIKNIHKVRSWENSEGFQTVYCEITNASLSEIKDISLTYAMIKDGGFNEIEHSWIPYSLLPGETMIYSYKMKTDISSDISITKAQFYCKELELSYTLDLLEKIVIDTSSYERTPSIAYGTFDQFGPYEILQISEISSQDIIELYYYNSDGILVFKNHGKGLKNVEFNIGKFDINNRFLGYVNTPIKLMDRTIIDEESEYHLKYTDELQDQDIAAGYTKNSLQLVSYSYALEEPDEFGCSFYYINLRTGTAYGYSTP